MLKFKHLALAGALSVALIGASTAHRLTHAASAVPAISAELSMPPPTGR